MDISLIGQSICGSVTLKINETAAILKEEGKPVIHLGGGEPKSKAPEEAIAMAKEILETGYIRYTPAGGICPLKKSIIAYTEEFYGRTPEPENVIISSGAKQSLMVLLQTIINPNNEVIFPVPYWVSYPEMVKMCYGKPVAVKPEKGGFLADLNDLKKAVTPQTKAVIINSPNNPSGAMYGAEFIAGIVHFCEENDIYLIMDDIYHRLVFDGKEPISSYDFTEKPVDESKIVIINGISKQYSMTGFRIGWAVGNRDIIEVMTNIQGHQTAGVSIILQKAAIGALEGDQSFVTNLSAGLQKNRDLMMNCLAKIPKLNPVKPDGTFYCFVDFSVYDSDSTRLAKYLLEEALVATVPGVEFGLDGHLRLSTCGAPEEIEEGIERIRKALEKYPKAEVLAVEEI